MDSTVVSLETPTSPWMDSAEAEFIAAVPRAQRKKLGQFFTPPAIASAMVDWACRHRPGRFLDPAVGPGVFPACAARLPRERRPRVMTGYDIDPVALTTAKRRFRDIEPPVKLRRADFLTADFAERFDAIVCNPPYIPDGTELEPEVAEHDPHRALFGGPDGMAVIAAAVSLAARWLRPGGAFAVEHDDTTSRETVELVSQTGVFGDVTARADLAGRPRFVTALRQEKGIS